MLYLDNAATSFPKPPEVIEAVNSCLCDYCANSGRSSHFMAVRTADEIYLTREAISDFFSLNAPENVIFTLNATYALNIAIKSVLTEKCHVLISDMEHNAVLRPLYSLSQKIGLEYSVFSTLGCIDENINALLRDDTVAIISTLASNVTGKEISLELLSDIAKRHRLILILDASQLAGHKMIDMSKTERAVLCAPGHKGLFGVQGCGFALFKGISPIYTLIEGGTGSASSNASMPDSLPEHFEAGTLPTPSIVSLRRGIEFIRSYGVDNISDRISDITDCFIRRLKCIDNICIYGGENGIISFYVKGTPISEIVDALNRQMICVRDGLHCAPLAHKALGTENTGLIRVSLSVFNDCRDADALYKVLNTLSR